MDEEIMGTDIHLYAEIRVQGDWRPIGGMEQNSICFMDEDTPPLYKPIEVYDTRNRSLFAILADVHNPPFFITLNNAKLDVIAPPRGLPSDLSPGVKQWANWWREEMFGAGWLHLSEVLDFDWHGKTMRFEAMVDSQVAHLFHEDEPFPYKQWIEGVQISYARYMADGVTVRWISTYAEAVGLDVLEIMHGLTQHGKPSDIRLVFWFDE
jgi:hypothetical protein